LPGLLRDIFEKLSFASAFGTGLSVTAQNTIAAKRLLTDAANGNLF